MTERMPGPTSHTYFSQRLRLHYVDWGNPDKPPLLLIHGGRDHCRNWDWTAAALRDDWHVIAPDLRGHGDSQWSPDGSYTMAGYLYDLAQLVHQQRLAPVMVIAHSLGGNIALRYAGIYPEAVAKLVAIEGLGPAPRALAERGAPTIAARMDAWTREQRGLAGRLPRRYASIEDAFHHEHRSVYGHENRAATIELVNARLAAYGLVPKPATDRYRSATASLDGALVERRPVWFGGAPVDCPVWERERLPERARLAGPAIVEEFGATTVLPPGWVGDVDEHGNLMLEREAGA
jgi:pimeloyl-ACP methyl ester carboxylesterase